MSSCVVYIIKSKENREDARVYVGSSQLSLKKIWAGHLSSYRQYKKTGKAKRSSAYLFNKYGEEGCVIEILEEFPYYENMYDKEWFYMQKYIDSCVNLVRPAGISDKSVPYRL